MSGTTKTAEVEDTTVEDAAPDAGAEVEEVEEAEEQTGEDTGRADEGAGEAGASGSDSKRKPDLVPRSELTKVIRERQEAKRKARELEQKLAEKERENETEAERAKREAIEATRAEIEGKYKPLVVRTTAEAALIAAGVGAGETDEKARRRKIDRVIRLMNLDDIEINDRGEVDGVDAQIAELQEEYPELFTQPQTEEKTSGRRKTVGARAADGADKPPAKKKIKTEELIMKKLRGEA